MRLFRQGRICWLTVDILALLDQTCRTHTCHTSHCEIKSHRIWPIWKAIPIQIFKSHRIFRPFYDRFSEVINKSHIVIIFISFLHEKKKKDDRLYWGSSKVMFKKISQKFVKSPFKFCLISQILVTAYGMYQNMASKQCLNCHSPSHF